MKRVWTDRSRIETHQRCHRLRHLQYHECGIGLVTKRMPLPLAVGLSVHVGLATLLQGVSHIAPIRDAIAHGAWDPMAMHALEEDAVNAALADFQQYISPDAGLDLPTEEQLAIQPGGSLTDQLAGSLTRDDSNVIAMNSFAADEITRIGAEAFAANKSDYDAYLAAEQSALVEALVRAWARRRLRPLLEQYEVLEVEREGEWLLHQGFMDEGEGDHGHHYQVGPFELWFMSRPDALLRDRTTNDLVIQSFKTTASWDVRKERDAQHDMQGLSEGVEVERRLADWWAEQHEHKTAEYPYSPAMYTFLSNCAAPPRISAIRYEYLLKGDRDRDQDLAARLGLDVRSQRSHLIRGYLNAGMAAGDEQWNWSWSHLKADGSGETSKLYWKNWRGAAVWEHMSIEKWITMLDESAIAVSGDTGQELGYKSDAQATGYTIRHPLDAAFPAPIIVYRNDDELRDWIEQVEAQEVEVARHVEEVRTATDDAERRHLLNVYFPMHRRACEYPTTCAMVGVCFGGAEAHADPMSTGKFKLRVPNHEAERKAAEAKEAQI